MAMSSPDYPPGSDAILKLREQSRKLVRELGFMRPSIAGSDLAPSAVHAIIEIGHCPGIQARDLAKVLRLDKSNTSRQIAKLESQGLVFREIASSDARSSNLFLTENARTLLKRIDVFATNQVSTALGRLAPDDQKSLIRCMSLYADALARQNPNEQQATPAADDRICQGYIAGCIGDIASLHARYYAKSSGFGVFFENKVATELAGFVQSLPASDKEIWLYVEDGRSLASVVVDGDATAKVAHLRWFIVDESLRGTGIGRRLLTTAMKYIDERFDETYLWTFDGLEAARHLYESAGFGLAEEAAGKQWGSTVIEQRFVRKSHRAWHSNQIMSPESAGSS